MNAHSFPEVVLSQIVLPYQANPAGNVHGGEIIKLMDSAAGAAAQKHCHTNIVTARIDELRFKKPILVGNLVICTAQVIYTGNTSMEVFVTVESEDLMKDNGSQIALTAFFTMVSLDTDGKPTSVPKLNSQFSSAYEQKLYCAGEKRYLAHCKRK